MTTIKNGTDIDVGVINTIRLLADELGCLVLLHRLIVEPAHAADFAIKTIMGCFCLQGLLQQVLGGNEDVVVTAGKKGPKTTIAFYQLEVRLLPVLGTSHLVASTTGCTMNATEAAASTSACH